MAAAGSGPAHTAIAPGGSVKAPARPWQPSGSAGPPNWPASTSASGAAPQGRAVAVSGTSAACWLSRFKATRTTLPANSRSNT